MEKLNASLVISTLFCTLYVSCDISSQKAKTIHNGSYGNESLNDCKVNFFMPVLEKLNICLDVSERSWEDSLKKNPDLVMEWRSYCDSSYFTIHKMASNIQCDSLFLLEAKIGHGSGEYDNFIIRKINADYEIIQEFKGYLDSVIRLDTGYFRYIYSFNITPDIRYSVMGTFNGYQIITDTILNSSNKQYGFEKGKAWD